ncbi:hypothetical protein DESC_500146 [Desulfosarcina cetonica]|uniref:hypothetical protein n=1 Tax=Desulfosarcina cetonica TaxID=90730 RepID=UPI0006D22EFC|nr:hypothetical protein [Desulfosarcina cetonica]VTR66762.1 hypothetical protein DESC_500146 [Desulfosarcina cetonica]
MPATKSGPALWPVEANDQKLKTMVDEIGQPLMDLAAWAGQRAAEGDRESLGLLVRHVIEIVRTTEIISREQKSN